MTGVDVSSAAISAAKSTHPTIDFRVVDGTRLPFDPGTFDLVVSFHVIEHVVAYETYLGEIKRILAPGGVAVFTTPNARLRLDPGMKPWNEFLREFADEELAALLSQHFACARVYGLLADEPLQSIEEGRVRRARRSARELTSRGPPPAAPGILGRTVHATLQSVVRAARSLIARGHTAGVQPVGRGEAPALDPAFIKAHGVEQLHYVSTGLEKSLDLLAVCSDDARAFETGCARLS